MAQSGQEQPARRSLLGAASIYTLSNIAGAAIPFALMPVLTRKLVPADYGITAMFTTVVAVFGCFAGLSVHGAVNLRYSKREGFDLPVYVGTALGVLAASTSALMLVVLLFHRWIAAFVEIPERWVFAAVIVAGANFVAQVRLVLWQQETKAVSFMAFSLSSSALNLLSSIALVVVADMHYAGRLIAATGTSLVFAVIALISLRRSGFVRFTFDRESARDALRFGIPLVPHALGALVITLADRFFITKYVGVAETGVYMVGAQLSMVVSVLADAANKAFSPWLYAKLETSTDEDKHHIVRLTYFYFIAISALALALAATAPWFIRFVVGPRFYGATPFILWLSLGAAFRGMYFMVTDFVFYAKRADLLAVVTFSTGIMNVLLNYALIRTRGAIGAAEATCAAYLVSFLGTWYISARVYPMPWRAGVARLFRRGRSSSATCATND